MRNFSQLFASLLMLLSLLFVGCSKEESTPEPEPEPESITYSATYTVSEISDDFFELGGFFVSYADKDGKSKSEDITKAQIPFTVTVEGLKEDSKLAFDLFFGYYSDNPGLTKEQYTFKRSTSLTLRGSDGSLKASTIRPSGSISMKADKVQAYLEKVIQEEGFESTVKTFLSGK